ncbi:glycine cleavage system protein H [Paucilactobacillus kaifaensis]|uniref:glycine cleavage system protein H n=1 Tax=Paucilactobacillus kaifaensis TaxID=2559921 RepID=UPI0010F54EFF|nr:glycine cleavage system protein H [Paucilactobacillus kaifaensis]
MSQLRKIFQRFLALFGHHSSKSYEQNGLKISEQNGLVKVGLTGQILQEIGEVSFIKSPDLNDHINQGDQLLDVEGGKVVETFPSPINGKIIDLNSDLIDEPGQLSDQNSQWLVTIKAE